jgi:hypothetical protein
MCSGTFRVQLDLILRYVGGDGVRLHGYSYSDWVASAVDRKSTSSDFLSLGSTMVSWFHWK